MKLNYTLYLTLNYLARHLHDLAACLQILQTTHGAEWRQAHVEIAPFYTNKEVDHLLKDVEVTIKYSFSIYQNVTYISNLSLDISPFVV